MATATRYSGPADPSTPCDRCAGPTYTFASGSVWCPDEGCEPGGHFVVRVAFERKPGADPLPLKRDTKRDSINHLASRGSTKAKAQREAKPAAPTFDAGFDAFVKGR